METNLVVAVYRDPARLTAFSPREWDLFIRQARQAQLLASFYHLFRRTALLDAVPPRPLNHLLAAKTVADKHAQDTRWEISRLRKALAPLGVATLVLKGGAYVAAGLANGEGRLFQDIDILVPRAKLPAVEQALNRGGWYSTHVNAYDDRYYRQWMHEIPPMRHLKRKTLLDVHHQIVPLTAPLHPSVDKLLADARPIDGCDGVQMLSEVDLVLHSAVHLFHDGEFDHALRDLVDIDQLIRRSGGTEGFIDRLKARALELDLARPLYYALRYLARLFQPDYLDAERADFPPGKPNPLLLPLMDALFTAGILAHHPSCARPGAGFCRWCLYVRAHYLRMPPHLLIPHLVYKALHKDE